MKSRHFIGQFASEEGRYHAFDTTFRCARAGEPICETTSRSLLTTQELVTDMGRLLHLAVENEYPKSHSMISVLADAGLVDKGLLPNPDYLVERGIPTDQRLIRDRMLSTAVWDLEDEQIQQALLSAERERLAVTRQADDIERRHGFINLIREDGEERSFVLDLFRIGAQMPVSLKVRQHIAGIVKQELPNDEVYTVQVPTCETKATEVLGAFSTHGFDGDVLSTTDSGARELLVPNVSDRLWDTDIETLLTAIVRGEIDRLVGVLKEDAPAPGHGEVNSGLCSRWQNLYQNMIAADYFPLPPKELEAYRTWLF